MKARSAAITLLSGALLISAFAQQSSNLSSIVEHGERLALKRPRPPYPAAARAKHITGSGVFEVRVDAATGQVISVTVFRSTGSDLLDQSALETLRHWEFRPNTIVRAKIPISFNFSATTH